MMDLLSRVIYMPLLFTHWQQRQRRQDGVISAVIVVHWNAGHCVRASIPGHLPVSPYISPRPADLPHKCSHSCFICLQLSHHINQSGRSKIKCVFRERICGFCCLNKHRDLSCNGLDSLLNPMIPFMSTSYFHIKTKFLAGFPTV